MQEKIIMIRHNNYMDKVIGKTTSEIYEVKFMRIKYKNHFKFLSLM